jgi:hypothetical protein
MLSANVFFIMSLPSRKHLPFFLAAIFLASCETMPEGIQEARLAMAQRIESEPRGDYFIGRRYVKLNCKFWGYVRAPGQPWSSAQLVMLNENQKLAPDREQAVSTEYERTRGLDNNYEYKLYGYFSGDNVYDLVSNAVYPEFVLTGYELISTDPPPIFKSQFRGNGNSVSGIEKPE